MNYLTEFGRLVSCGPRNNDNEGVLIIPQSSKIGASPLDAV